MQTCKDGTLSSTEFNSTPFIASVMQEYFLKLVGRYRFYITPDTGPPPSPAGQGMPRAASAKSVGGSSSGGGKDADDVLRWVGRLAWSGLAWSGQGIRELGLLGSRGPHGAVQHSCLCRCLRHCGLNHLRSLLFTAIPWPGAGVLAERLPKAPPNFVPPASRTLYGGCRAHGYAFDQAAFVAQHRSAAVRQFLQHFRNSQMFEVFITERLLAVSKGNAAPETGFEAKVGQRCVCVCFE